MKTQMIFQIILLLLSLAQAQRLDNPVDSDGMILMNDGNYERIIKYHDNLLVFAYAPWCGHCIKMKPVMAQVVRTLRSFDIPVGVAKVDATQNPKVSEFLGVQSIPLLKLKRNGEKTLVKFQGQRDLTSVIEFIEKKVITPDNEITCQELKDKINDPSWKRNIVVYFGNNLFPMIDEFNQGIAEDKSSTLWVQNYDAYCAAEFDTNFNSSILILPPGHDSRERIQKHNQYYNLWSWVRKTLNTPVFRLESKYKMPIYTHKWRVIILMTDGDKTKESYYKVFERIAAKTHNFLFAVSDGTNDMHQTALDEMGFKDVQLPAIGLYSINSTDEVFSTHMYPDLMISNLKIHKYNQSVTKLDAQEFVDWIDMRNFDTSDAIKPFSQPIIKEQDWDRVRFYKLTEKEWVFRGLNHRDIVFIYAFNPANQKNRKLKQKFQSIARMGTVGGERKYLNFDFTANHVPNLYLPKSPGLYMFDKSSIFNDEYRIVEWENTANEYELLTVIEDMIDRQTKVYEERNKRLGIDDEMRELKQLFSSDRQMSLEKSANNQIKRFAENLDFKDYLKK